MTRQAFFVREQLFFVRIGSPTEKDISDLENFAICSVVFVEQFGERQDMIVKKNRVRDALLANTRARFWFKLTACRMDPGG